MQHPWSCMACCSAICHLTLIKSVSLCVLLRVETNRKRKNGKAFPDDKASATENDLELLGAHACSQFPVCSSMGRRVLRHRATKQTTMQQARTKHPNVISAAASVLMKERNHIDCAIICLFGRVSRLHGVAIQDAICHLQEVGCILHCVPGGATAVHGVSKGSLPEKYPNLSRFVVPFSPTWQAPCQSKEDRSGMLPRPQVHGWSHCGRWRVLCKMLPAWKSATLSLRQPHACVHLIAA